MTETAMMSRTTPVNMILDMKMTMAAEVRRAIGSIIRKAREEG